VHRRRCGALDSHDRGVDRHEQEEAGEHFKANDPLKGEHLFRCEEPHGYERVAGKVSHDGKKEHDQTTCDVVRWSHIKDYRNSDLIKVPHTEARTAAIRNRIVLMARWVTLGIRDLLWDLVRPGRRADRAE
jgi:hypothetical protein